MFRTIAPQQSLWASVLPEVARGLPPQLAELDTYLDDPRFYEPFRPYFCPDDGRPSVPMETYVRMMALKYRSRLGFEALCAEVSDSISWRLFCRVPLGEAVPHPSTLEKVTSRCGQGAVDQLNEALLKKGHGEHLVKLDKVRVDTTVVPANVRHPTDSDLLAHGVSRLALLTARLKAMGLAARTKARDRRRAVRAKTYAIGAFLRRRTEEAKAEVLAITAEVATVAEAALADAGAVAANVARTLRRQGTSASGRARSTLTELKDVAATLEKALSQTRARLGGQVPDGAERVVSFHDKDARPIRKGRLGVPVEFGYKAQVADNSDGVVLDHSLFQGNPFDGTLLVPAIERINARFGKVPRAVAADRGYGEARVGTCLTAMGVKKVAIPRRGRPSATRRRSEATRGFRNLVKWRTGAEGRIAALKRGYGWSRTLMDGTAGAATWCAWGIFAHNGIKLAHLSAVRTASPPAPLPSQRRRPIPPGEGPPGDAPHLTPPLAA
jgi:transposase, IS5 family